MAGWDADGITPIRDMLTLPYRQGAAGGAIEVDNATLTVTRPHPEPVLLLRLTRPLGPERVVVRPTIGETALDELVFAPYSDSGSQLPLHAPAVIDGIGGAFTVDLAVFHQLGDSAFTDGYEAVSRIPDEDIGDWLEGNLITGVLGKLVYLADLEKQRIIRQARELHASRILPLARRSSLDTRGIELGVPRRSDVDEPDDPYRARLAIYSPFRLATSGGFSEALNGPGGDDEPNRGLPAMFGVEHRFHVVEETNPLSLALRLVAVGADEQRMRFQRRLRSTFLVDLVRLPSDRLPEPRRSRWLADRATLREHLTRDNPDAELARYFHPVTAEALATAVRIARAAGHRAGIRLLRAHDPSGGSTFELGLSVELARFTRSQFETIAENLTRVRDEGDRAVADGMTPETFGDDPLGRWFFEACGFQTILPGADDSVVLSPFSMRGLRIEGPGSIEVGERAGFRASYTASSTGGLHVNAAEALDDLPEVLGAAGLDPPSDIHTGADLVAVVESIAGQEAVVPETIEPLVDSGIVSPDGPAYAATLRDTADLDHAIGLVLSSDQLSTLGDGDDLVEALAGYGEAIFDAGFSSVRGLWDADGDVLELVASVSQLPGSLAVPGEPPAAAYWWSRTEVPRASLDRQPLEIAKRAGPTTEVVGVRPGLGLVAVIGYSRQGLADPFEVRIELEDPDALLDLDEYGYLMNLLEACYPIGIEINTFDIRRRHVDVDGDGEPEWLTSRASRTYHYYRQTRWSRRSTGRIETGAST